MMSSVLLGKSLNDEDEKSQNLMMMIFVSFPVDDGGHPIHLFFYAMYPVNEELMVG